MKKILIFCLVLFLTGCKAQYNLEINSDNIVEDVTVSIPKSITERSIVESSISIDNFVYPGSDYNDVYNGSLKEDDNNYYMNYNYTHDVSKFSKSLFLKRCYDNVMVKESGNEISLLTSDTFFCLNMLDDGFYLDEVSIAIKTDLNVISNNADKVSGNTYIWNIDNSNYNNKSISLMVRKPNNIQDIIVENNSSFILIFIVITILTLLLIIYIVVKLKAKKNNDI